MSQQKAVHCRFVVMKPKYKHGENPAKKTTGKKRELSPNRDMIGGRPFDLALLDALEEFLKGLDADIKQCWIQAAAWMVVGLQPSHFMLTDKGDPQLFAGEPFKVDKKDKFSLVVAGALGQDPLNFLTKDPGWAKVDFGRPDFEKILLSWAAGEFPDIDLEALFLRAAQMMVKAFRESMSFTDGQVLTAVNNNLLNRIYPGIGVLIEEIEEEPLVYQVAKLVEKGPAEKAKIQVGDWLYEVDGQAARNYTLLQLARILRGPVGESLDITVVREGKEIKVKVKRDSLKPFQLYYIEGLTMHPDGDDGLGWCHVIEV